MYKLMVLFITVHFGMNSNSKFHDLEYSVHKGSNIGVLESNIVSTEYWVEIHNYNLDSINVVTNKQMWLQYLDDESTSWETNLLLYAIHKKNAYWFYASGDKQKWFSSYRTADIDNWVKMLN